MKNTNAQADDGSGRPDCTWDPRLGRKVVISALRPHLSTNDEIRERFLADARLLARIHHPNLVAIYNVGEADGRPFFTSECVEGYRLSALLARATQVPLDHALYIIKGVSGAVDVLHAAGFVYRGLNPANIMIERSGRVVVMTFGVARLLVGRQNPRARATLGSVAYMAPEEVLGKALGPATGVYSLGVLAYQLLAGRLPFEGDAARVLDAHVHRTPPSLRSLRPGLGESTYSAVETALAKEPARRPASPGIFAAMLGRPTHE